MGNLDMQMPSVTFVGFRCANIANFTSPELIRDVIQAGGGTYASRSRRSLDL
jgi:hypothetical protein